MSETGGSSGRAPGVPGVGQAAATSVFLAALGDDAERLHPAVRAYAAGAPNARGETVATGVFDVAGCPLAWLARAAAVVLGPDLLVTRHERDVPFTLIERHGALPSGRAALHAARAFRFAGAAQAFSDVLLVADRPGLLVNLLGPSRRLEALLECSVGSGGTLRLRERAARLRLGPRRRLPIPRWFVPRICVENGFDDATGQHTIATRVAMPLIGTVMQYRGRFDLGPRAG